MNSINLVGRLTRDPELREIKDDTKVTGMRIAIPRRPERRAAGSGLRRRDGLRQASRELLGVPDSAF